MPGREPVVEPLPLVRVARYAGYVALLCLTVAGAATAQITGLAEVVDADTIRINDTELHLFGIDAVERDQLCTHRGERLGRVGCAPPVCWRISWLNTR